MNPSKKSFFLFLKETRTYLGPRNMALFACAVLFTLMGFFLSTFFLPLPVIVQVLVLFCLAWLCLLLVYRNTARSGIEDKIRNMELGAVVENIRDGVVVYDPNFKIISMNRAAEALFGISAKEVMGMFITPELVNNARFRVLTQVVFPSLAPSISVVSNEWPQIVDLIFEDPRLELRTVLNKIVGDGGEVVGFLKLITDTTREGGILASKGEFITIAAHQLRTPLTALGWIFETIQKTATEEKKIDPSFISNIREGWGLTQRSLKIINDLLDVARIEEGRFGFHFQDVVLAELVKAVSDEATIIARERGVTIRFSTSAERGVVWADPERLGIAISNFVDNAIKYNIKGGLVDISVDPSADGLSLVVRITDTGVGIKKEDVVKLSQKFYRGENATQLEPNGSGLGVYIAKNIIERHGGTMRVVSELERGTTFSFTVPIKSAEGGSLTP